MEKHYTEFLRAIERYSRESGREITVLSDEPMSRHTTFHIGGPADLYAEPNSEAALIFLLRTVKKLGIRFMVIGRGSNLLFDDAGYRGVVIATVALRNISVNGTLLHAEAGAALRACANAALEHSLTGLEFAHGIPGGCGGAVFMNAGAYDGEVSHVLIRSRCYDCDTDTIGDLDTAAHNFGYRESIYRAHPSWVLLSADFRLERGNSAEIRAKMDDLMHRRTEKQPLEYPSAGSTFKRYPGRFTAQMIDEAGLKGYTIGGAQVSEKHAGFIINRGNATSADVRALIAHIQKELETRFGVQIEPEVIRVRETET